MLPTVLPALLPASGEGEAVSRIFAIFAFLAIYFGFIFLIVVASYVVTSWSLMALFKKTGIEGWKAWVPYYQNWIWLRLGGQSGHWLWACLIPGGSYVMMVFIYIGMHKTNIAFRKDTGFFVLGIFFPFIWAFILGYGRDPYEPYLIAQRGYPLPLEGYGSYDPARQQPTM